MTAATIGTKRAPHGTQEWAASNVNIQDGCEHDCRYCYAKSVVGIRGPVARGRDE